MSLSVPLALLLNLTATAHALRPVSPTINQQDYQDIQAELSRGRTHEQQVQLYQEAIDDELSALTKTPGLLERLHQQQYEEKRLRNISMTIVIKKTMAAYDIPTPSGASAHELNKGSKITFLPVFNPELADTYTVATPGRALKIPARDPNSLEPELARTIFNGVAIVRAMPDDPRDIALLLIHESTHAEQFIGAKQRDYAEYRARRAAYDSFLAVGYDKSDETKRKLYENYARKAKADADYAATFLGKSVLFFRGASPAAEDAERHGFGLSQDKLDYLKAQAQNLRDSVAREESYRAEEALRQVVPPLQPAGPAAPSVDDVPRHGLAAPEARGYEYAPRDGAWQLRSLAVRACANPGAITENDFAPLSWFPTIRAITDAASASQGLSACASAMYWELLRCDPHQPRPSATWVNERASSFSSPPVAEEYIREPRTKSRGCIMRGVWFPDCY